MKQVLIIPDVNNIEEQKGENAEEQTVEATAETAEAAASETAETTDSEAEETATAEPVDEKDAKIAELEAQVAAQKDQYLRLYAEFDNYKKRTLKEKAELLICTSERFVRSWANTAK